MYFSSPLSPSSLACLTSSFACTAACAPLITPVAPLFAAASFALALAVAVAVAAAVDVVASSLSSPDVALSSTGFLTVTKAVDLAIGKLGLTFL